MGLLITHVLVCTAQRLETSEGAGAMEFSNLCSAGEGVGLIQKFWSPHSVPVWWPSGSTVDLMGTCILVCAARRLENSEGARAPEFSNLWVAGEGIVLI